MTKPAEGPWKVLPTLAGFAVRHQSCVEYYLEGMANVRCAELNAAERVRDASPALLAACEAAEPVFADAVSAFVAARIPGWQKLSAVRDQLQAAIAAAKGAG